MIYRGSELESGLSVKQAVLVTNHEMRYPFAFVDKQRGRFGVRRYIERDVGGVGFAGPQRRRQRFSVGLRRIICAPVLAGDRVLVSSLVDQG